MTIALPKIVYCLDEDNKYGDGLPTNADDTVLDFVGVLEGCNVLYFVMYISNVDFFFVIIYFLSGHSDVKVCHGTGARVVVGCIMLPNNAFSNTM